MEPIALMKGVEDINVPITKTALVEEPSATIKECVFQKEDHLDQDLDQDPNQGAIKHWSTESRSIRPKQKIFTIRLSAWATKSFILNIRPSVLSYKYLVLKLKRI